MRPKKALRLLRKYVEGNATAEEKAIIDKWYNSIEDSSQTLPDDMIKENLYQRIAGELNKKPLIVSFYRKTLYKVAVAASILLLISAGTYFLFFNHNTSKSNLGKEAIATIHDVKPPITNRATITMANGKTVYLDSVANGTLATEGNVRLVKLADGQIAYTGSTNEVLYNTLANPRGSKVLDMTLSDGSHVWLNAGSSIKYPIAFVGNERKVTITGEAYFEVTHNAAIPFKVSKGEMEITVLGTHFNVNTYDDESDMKVTLLEGSVKVAKGNELGLLKPGQQAQVTNEVKVVHAVDIDEVMAWKNGFFNFKSADIKDILRQAARWYDIEVEYKGSVSTDRFKGKVPRDAKLSELLKILELNGVKFTIEGKRISVL
jgi:ferric-dicitrate binding protein FerR (iron transport regulator)